MRNQTEKHTKTHALLRKVTDQLNLDQKHDEMIISSVQLKNPNLK